MFLLMLADEFKGENIQMYEWTNEQIHENDQLNTTVKGYKIRMISRRAPNVPIMEEDTLPNTST